MPLQPRLLPFTLSESLALFSSGTSAAIITAKDGADAGIASTCTLRQAIESANDDTHGASTCKSGSGANTIVVAFEYQGDRIFGGIFESAP